MSIGLPESLGPLSQGVQASLAEGAGRAAASLSDCRVLCAPGGFGKTTVLESAVEAARDAHRFVVLRSSCLPNAPSTTYGVWQRVVTDLEELLPATSTLGPLITELGAGAFINHPTDHASYRRAIHQQLFDALAEVSRHAPLVVVVEGLHLADSQSVLTFRRLADLMAKAPIACALWGTARGQLAALASSVEAGHLREHILPPLPAELSENFLRIAEARAEGALASPVRRTLIDSGNPGLIARWVARGCDSDAVAERAEALTSYEEACACAFDAMDAPTRHTLCAIAVLARHFEPAELEELLDVVDEAAPLDALVNDGLVLRAGRLHWMASEGMGEAAYRGMTQTLRGALHRALARGLRSSPSPSLQRLAWHYERAGHGAEASRTWILAARNAEHAHANNDALEMYVRAARVTLDRIQASQAVASRMQLLVKMGRNDDAVAELDKLIGIADRNGSSIEQAHLLAERAHVAYRSGRGADILRFATEALAVARATGDRAATAHALRFVGVAHEFAGRFADAEAIYLEIVELESAESASDYLGGVCNSLGEIARATGRLDEALLWYDRFDEEWRKSNVGCNIVYLSNKGAALVQVGKPGRAKALLTDAIDEMERTGHRALVSESYYYRGLAHLADGELLSAASDAANGFLVAEELGETEMQGLLARLLGQVRQREVEAGESEMASPALEMLERSVSLLAQAGKPAEEAQSRIMLARTLASQGKVARAAMTLQLAVALAAERELWTQHAEANGLLDSLGEG